MGIFVPRFVRQLRDVLLTAPADGEVLTYDSADEKWKNEAGGGGGGDLTDAVILDPQTSARNTIAGPGDVIRAIVKAHAAQSVDLTQWQTSAGVPLLGVGANGSLVFGETPGISFPLMESSSMRWDYLGTAGGEGSNWNYVYGKGIGASGFAYGNVAFYRGAISEPAWTFGVESDDNSLSPTTGAKFFIYDPEFFEYAMLCRYQTPPEFPRAVLLGQVAAFTDANIQNGYGGWWWDQANSLPKWKGKTSGGVVVNFIPVSQTSFDDHSVRHENGGADAIKLDDLAAPDDNTDLNVSTTKHGLAPKLSNVATEYLSGTGAFSTPSGSGIPSTIVDVKGDLIAASAADTVARLAVGTNGQVLTADSAEATGIKWAAAGGGIAATLFDANTILKADSDDTPVALTMAASTILARLAAGDIKAASVAEIITLLQAYAVGGTDVAVADGGTGASTAAAARANLEVASFATLKTGSGWYYATGSSPGVRALVDLRPYGIPMALPAGTLDRIGIEVTTLGASSAIRLGIYSDSGFLSPGALLLDAGTVASTTTGNKEVTISQAIATAGWYWLVACSQGGTPAQVRCTEAPLPFPYTTGTIAPSGSGASFAYYDGSGPAGALPANFTSPPGFTFVAPRVYVRIA